MFVFHNSCGQNQTNSPKENIKSETKDLITSRVPNSMVRNIKQDLRLCWYDALLRV
jgi:hypothetical protein